MLVEASLAQLSPAQQKKLQKGQPVRVKHGSAHKVGVLPAQHRKLMKAHMKGKGMVLALPMQGGETAAPVQGNVKSVAKDSAKRLIVSGTDRAVQAIEGSGFTKSMAKLSSVAPLGSQSSRPTLVTSVIPRVNQKTLKGRGNLTATSKEAAKQLIVAGADRAIRAIEGSGSSRDFNLKEAANQLAEGRPFKKKDGSAPMSLQSMGMGVDSGKISRMKKFNRYSKAVGQKFLPIAKNLKPIKDAASARAAQYITEYNNPEALAKSALDTFQEEAPQTLASFRQPRASRDLVNSGEHLVNSGEQQTPVVYANEISYDPPTAYPAFPSVPTQYLFPAVPKQEELGYEPVVYYGSGGGAAPQRLKGNAKPAKGSPEMKAKMAALRAKKGAPKSASKPASKAKPPASKASKPAKGSPEMKAKMAALRAKKTSSLATRKDKSGGALYPAGY